MQKFDIMWQRLITDIWLVLGIILILYIFFKLKNYFRAVKLILTLGGPPLVPILGNAGYLYDEDLLRKMSHDAYKLYGALFRLWVTAFPFVVLLEPNDIQQVLGNPKHTEKVFFYKLLHNFLGRGLITSDAGTWRVHRKILQPIFHVSILEKFVETFNRSSRHLVQFLEDSGETGTDITAVVNDAIYEILNETVLGNVIKSEVSNSPFRKGQVLFSYRLTHPWLLIDWIYGRTSNGKLEQQHKKELSSACEEALKITESSRSKKVSLLELMKEAKSKYTNFTNEDITNECCTFMLAGQDSVGSAVALSLFMLAKHQDWQERCHEELEGIFEGNDGDPTLADLREMRCLEMCIKETLRLYPSVPLFARTLGEDVRIGRQVIPKGCNVLIMPYSTHRLPHHFSNPSEFDPERFNAKNSAARHPYAYLPFSAGPRNCIGYKFALIEMKSMISAVLRKFRLDLSPGREEISPKFRVTVRVKGGVWITARPRNLEYSAVP